MRRYRSPVQTRLTSNDISHLKALLSVQRRRLRALELDAAKYGTNSEVNAQIEMTKQAIRDTENQVAKLLKPRDKAKMWLTSLLGLLAMSFFITAYAITPSELRINFVNLGMGIVLVILIALLLVTFYRWITSGGDLRSLREITASLTSIILGGAALFVSIFLGITTNLISSYFLTISSNFANLLGVIVSLTSGLAGIIASLLIYVAHNRRREQDEIRQVRSQKITSTVPDVEHTNTTDG